LEKLKIFNCEILTADRHELDLRNQNKVELWFKKNKPDYVFLIAAKVGGIHANYSFPADFIYDNIMIQTNVIKSSFDYKVDKLIFLGSSCVYPKNIKKKIKESDLMSGYLEETNKSYAIAKISGLELIKSFRKQHKCNFISAMPCNIYGKNDNFDVNSSHVLPALIKKIVDAKYSNKKKITIWGSGQVRREFLYAEDVANCLIFLIENYNEETPINIAPSKDITIINLAKLISKVLNYKVNFIFDKKYPDGVLRKKLCTNKISNLGWRPVVPLEEGIKITAEWYIRNFKLI
jgi:GDP-L-fucose synthase